MQNDNFELAFSAFLEQDAYDGTDATYISSKDHNPRYA